MTDPKSLSERQQARLIANAWLDFKMNSFTQMIPGDPDCDACVVARQFLRVADALDAQYEVIKKLKENIKDLHYEINMTRHPRAYGRDVLDAKDEEIERLRAALQRIDNDGKNCPDYCLTLELKP